MQTQRVDIPAAGHKMVHHPAVEATCDASGNTEYWACSVCHKYFGDAEGKTEKAANSWVIPALGHSWGAITYTWSADNSTITALQVCDHDPNHSHDNTETVAAALGIVTPATCSASGKGFYVAEFTKAPFVTQTKNVTIPALGHTLTKHDAVPATCGAEGNSAYWRCSVCGKYFSDAGFTECEEGSWVVPQTGHEYGEPAWAWSEDYSTATATFTCVHDEAHTLEQTASIKDGSIKPGKRIEAQRHADGSQDYTAKVTGPDGTEYKVETTQILPATHKVHKDKKSKDNKSMTIDVETDTLKAAISGEVSAAAPALIASYDKDGRFLGLEVVTKATEAVEPAKGAESLKILWIDSSGYKPQSEAEEIDRME